MELGPIIRTLVRNKTRLILISGEVALTLAIVVNCINMMQDLKGQMDRPTGIAEEGIIVIRSNPYSENFKEDGYLENTLKSDLELLQSLPGVVAADVFSHIPLSGSGSSSGYKPLGSEMNTLPANRFITGTQGVETLGIQLIEGRNFTLDDINEAASKNVIITKALADRLFPDGDALGKQLQGRDPEDPATIVGILQHMHGSWPTWPYVTHVVLLPGEPGSFNWGVRYMVRSEPEAVEALIPSIEKRLLELEDGRNVELETLTEVKADTFEGHLAIIKMLRAVIVLLVFVTSLGIIGMTSFSVAERTHHIGTRRALGARRWDILRYFLAENWLITTVGLVLGVVLAYALNYLLVNFVSGAKLDLNLVVFGVLLLWMVGQVSALIPAWKGAAISPAIATRNV